MRYLILTLLLVMSLPVYIPKAVAGQAAPQHKGTLISRIDIEGFVLGDKSRFARLFKPYRNKYLTTADMDQILQKVRDIYEKEGYQQLVTISYAVIKHRLVYTALMTS